jgi:ligand-binding SRPBCC domain-containing protein
VDDAFAFFADASNLEAITPPWLRFRLITPGPIRMAPGARIEYRLRLHLVPIRWVSEITVWEPGRRFVDVQLRGPYELWEHIHTFEPAAAGTMICDRVRYALPYGPLGEAAHLAFVRRDLARIFEFRRQAVARQLEGANR